MIPLNIFQRWLLRLEPYLISPVGRLTKWRFVVYMAADRPRKLFHANRYPRQIIGVGIRLPDMEPQYVNPNRTAPFHPVLSVVWAKPRGSKRWRRNNPEQFHHPDCPQEKP